MVNIFNEGKQSQSLVERAVEAVATAREVWVDSLAEFHLGGKPSASGVIELLKPGTTQLPPEDVKE